MSGRRGFSLIELVIVVVIIGILGAIAIPRISRGTEAARINAFVKEINALATAIDHYQVQTGNKVTDSSTGRTPTELKDYLQDNAWEGETPIGGFWDIEVNDRGVGMAIGVHFMGVTVDRDAAKEVDEVLDDGNLKSGVFQQLAPDRYYLILEN